LLFPKTVHVAVVLCNACGICRDYDELAQTGAAFKKLSAKLRGIFFGVGLTFRRHFKHRLQTSRSVDLEIDTEFLG
jgi:hypothetical protein